MDKSVKKDVCVIDFAFQRIGGKYKGRILWALSKYDKMRYGELHRALEDISTKMLTQTLRELERDRLISRKMYPQVPPKVEYSLTATGSELVPFIAYLVEWGYKKMAEENI
ncbi:winged helix-turn-helix transcriptional regulator [Phocaeicola paurosaccharolyticus]|jgi:DNA-binding HxlR family transcriptional regulator|uniref:winged helix-turn-helix transcriptional regulator n=1 Tax=Phocaeicola paurosaccharolyticus TaxID=732242 RepID=UPI002FDFF0B2